MDGMVCDGSKCQNLNTWALFWINKAQMKQCRAKVVSRRKVAGAIRSLVNGRGFQLECARVL